ncbi:MAG: 5-formyltetrahydrofolate cyclo-ligase [Planctomycetes bacterium]|nr:5-formyltetrahydrofolate cyclo-ligase [Planctomycetota bacterium]
MKHNLRRRMRSVLRSIDADTRRARSQSACRRLLEQPEWQRARTVFVYLAMQQEIDTTGLIEAAWREGRRVLAPKVDAARREMHAVEVHHWGDCLPGYRNLLEPVGTESFPAADIDLIVLPGLAFDAKGVRLGTGGGYYDRFLAHPEVRGTCCGFAYERQFLAQVPREQHDRTVHMLVTDEGVRRYGG